MSARSSSSQVPILQAVLDAIADPVVVTDADGVVTAINTAAATRLGAGKYLGVVVAEQATRGEITSAAGDPLTPAEHPVSRVVATGEPVLGVTVAVRPASAVGGTFAVDALAVTVAGRVRGTVSVFHDAEKIAALEHALEDQTARLDGIVTLVDEAVFVVDTARRLVFLNAWCERLLGLALHATIDDRARQLNVRDQHGRPLPPQDFPSSRALAGETVSALRLIIDDRAGEPRHVLARAQPLQHADGTTYGGLVMMKDITDEIRGRDELEAARESAEEANHLKDQFIAALSHELRTPLQPILGWTEVLRRHGNLDEVTTQAIDAIRRNIRQQVRLVDDLLDLSRIVHGKFALRFETFDLREHVREAAAPFEEAAALKRVHLAVTLPTAPVMMWGDGARIQQITSNLISNAVKFTSAGGHVSVHLVVGEHEALIEVEDDGEGLAAEDIAVIFEAFRQGTGSRRRGGLGIGLDLVKRLVEMHGGTVEAWSEGRGYGARFHVRLPLRAAALAPPVTAPPESGRLGQRDILIIEDNADTRQVMKFMLEAEGARVETAEFGEAGIALAESHTPHVILCDIGRPDIDGLEVARRIRRLPKFRDTRIIALTGYGQPEDVDHALGAGFDAHLTKPINLDQLLALLVDA